HRVTVAQIKNWNHLTRNTKRIGQRLVIYTGNSAPASSASTSSATSSSGKTAAGKPQQPATQNGGASAIDPNLPYTTYVVKNGDTLYEIAKKYPGVSAQNIMDFNKIGSSIRPGTTIKIPKL
ncbi:MAG: LysM peptidoglycan-binding domain-containing protein, partial [Bacteroidales bacterium]|nr:LysM peptidoglycan-binding domain-containing protein [Bacteroidales bacterium]